jgi:hypothetical protein
VNTIDARRRSVTPSQKRMQTRARKLGELALKALEDIASGTGPAAIRLAAAREILDRGYGRPLMGEVVDKKRSLKVMVRRFTSAEDGSVG